MDDGARSVAGGDGERDEGPRPGRPAVPGHRSRPFDDSGAAPRRPGWRPVESRTARRCPTVTTRTDARHGSPRPCFVRPGCAGRRERYRELRVHGDRLARRHQERRGGEFELFAREARRLGDNRGARTPQAVSCPPRERATCVHADRPRGRPRPIADGRDAAGRRPPARLVAVLRPLPPAPAPARRRQHDGDRARQRRCGEASQEAPAFSQPRLIRRRADSSATGAVDGRCTTRAMCAFGSSFSAWTVAVNSAYALVQSGHERRCAWKRASSSAERSSSTRP